jgi:hypothetical protein
MRISVTGSFHNIDGGVERGQVVDVDEPTAHRYIRNGIAEPVEAEVEESAVLTPVAESAVVKSPRGRPKRVKPPAEWHDEKAPGWKEVEQE